MNLQYTRLRRTNQSRTLAGVIFLGAMLVGAAGVRAEIIEQILVKVNGEVFSKTDLEARQVAALRQMGQQADPKNSSDAQLRKMLDDVTPQILVNVIDEMLIIQRGKELGYKMSDDQFRNTLDLIKKDNKINSEEDFQAALKQENLSMADLRRNIERQWIVSRVQQTELLGKIAVSEEEARRYYEVHKNEFTTPSTVTLREILISLPKDATSAADAAAKQKASDIRARALKGEPFDKLAEGLSESPSRANAGLIGPLNVNDLSPELKALLDRMKPGDVSDVLRAANGYQILKLESATMPQTAPFEQAREEISNRVFTDKRKVEYEKYLTRLRGDAIIEWKNQDIKKAYEQGVAQQKTGAPASQ